MIQQHKTPDAYRFASKKYRGDSKQGKDFKKKHSVLNFKRKVCFLCGEDVAGYVKIIKTASGLKCNHIRPNLTADPKLTAGETKRIAERLKPGERAVKGNDGMIRIIE